MSKKIITPAEFLESTFNEAQINKYTVPPKQIKLQTNDIQNYQKQNIMQDVFQINFNQNIIKEQYVINRSVQTPKFGHKKSKEIFNSTKVTIQQFNQFQEEDFIFSTPIKKNNERLILPSSRKNIRQQKMFTQQDYVHQELKSSKNLSPKQKHPKICKNSPQASKNSSPKQKHPKISKNSPLFQKFGSICNPYDLEESPTKNSQSIDDDNISSPVINTQKQFKLVENSHLSSIQKIRMKQNQEQNQVKTQLLTFSESSIQEDDKIYSQLSFSDQKNNFFHLPERNLAQKKKNRHQLQKNELTSPGYEIQKFNSEHSYQNETQEQSFDSEYDNSQLLIPINLQKNQQKKNKYNQIPITNRNITRKSRHNMNSQGQINFNDQEPEDDSKILSFQHGHVKISDIQLPKQNKAQNGKRYNSVQRQSFNEQKLNINIYLNAKSEISQQSDHKRQSDKYDKLSEGGYDSIHYLVKRDQYDSNKSNMYNDNMNIILNQLKENQSANKKLVNKICKQIDRLNMSVNEEFNSNLQLENRNFKWKERTNNMINKVQQKNNQTPKVRQIKYNQGFFDNYANIQNQNVQISLIDSSNQV